jgi:hypothetical protein
MANFNTSVSWEEVESSAKNNIPRLLYINALAINMDLNEKIVDYDAYTGIEFNSGKSINHQEKLVSFNVAHCIEQTW